MPDKKILVVEGNRVPEGCEIVYEPNHSRSALQQIAILGAGLGIDIFDHKAFRQKPKKVFTEADQARIDKAQAKRDKRNAKRLAHGQK